MKWLEIIKIRSAVMGKENILSDLLLQFNKMLLANKPSGIFLYHHANLKTDLSIHIHWETEGTVFNKSCVGVRIAHVLKDFGLVNHSVWVSEQNDKLGIPI